jgi:ADP-dependent NAD(P)H-hydrate dehydratase
MLHSGLTETTAGEPMDIPKLRARERDTHKNDYGRVFILAGSAGMVGSAFLASEAALRSGAGYVQLGMPWRLTALAASNPYTVCVLTKALKETEEGTLALMAKPQILEAAADYDVAAIGPGLSLNAQTQELVNQLLIDMNHAIVLDADGLNAVAKHPATIDRIRRDKGLPIFTPHPGEFARLRGIDKTPIEPAARVSECRGYAAERRLVCVLKGHNTVVSDGKQVYTNTTGNPGMATAGTGDVLTGVIAALRGQGFDSYDAACLGVYLHGLAGDIAAAELGEWGMTAHDIVRSLPLAFRRHYEAGLKDGK